MSMSSDRAVSMMHRCRWYWSRNIEMMSRVHESRVWKPLETSTTTTAEFLSGETRCIELSVADIWSPVGRARVSCYVDKVVICVCTEWCMTTTTSTTHFRGGKVIVAFVTSLSEMALAIGRTRVSFGVEVRWRVMFTDFQRRRGGWGWERDHHIWFWFCRPSIHTIYRVRHFLFSIVSSFSVIFNPYDLERNKPCSSPLSLCK